MNTTNITDKFKDMDYETAVKELTRLIGILERSEGTLDELMQIYKEAFEYYAYCSEYLSETSHKVKELNDYMAGLMKNQEEI